MIGYSLRRNARAVLLVGTVRWSFTKSDSQFISQPFSHEGLEIYDIGKIHAYTGFVGNCVGQNYLTRSGRMVADLNHGPFGIIPFSGSMFGTNCCSQKWYRAFGC